MSDLISRADAIDALCHNCAYYTDAQCKTDSGYWCESGAMIREDIPSAEAEPTETSTFKEETSTFREKHQQWNCTANFIAEQLDRLRNMTDEERWDFFIKFFSPSADRPTEMLDDRTLVVKVPNAKEVGRVWVQDTDKNVHIGGGFYYHEDSADRPSGTWEHWGSPFSDESEVIDTIVCSVCGARFIEPKDEPKGEYNYCPSCGAMMTPYKGGDDE